MVQVVYSSIAQYQFMRNAYAALLMGEIKLFSSTAVLSLHHKAVQFHSFDISNSKEDLAISLIRVQSHMFSTVRKKEK